MSESAFASVRDVLVRAMVSMSTLRESSKSLRFIWTRAAPPPSAAAMAARFILRAMARTSPETTGDSVRSTWREERRCTARTRRTLRQ
nr:unnamed protein product [Digitaria exilis]